MVVTSLTFYSSLSGFLRVLLMVVVYAPISLMLLGIGFSFMEADLARHSVLSFNFFIVAVTTVVSVPAYTSLLARGEDTLTMVAVALAEIFAAVGIMTIALLKDAAPNIQLGLRVFFVVMAFLAYAIQLLVYTFTDEQGDDVNWCIDVGDRRCQSAQGLRRTCCAQLALFFGKFVYYTWKFPHHAVLLKANVVVEGRRGSPMHDKHAQLEQVQSESGIV